MDRRWGEGPLSLEANRAGEPEAEPEEEAGEAVLSWLRGDVVGAGAEGVGPFGRRRLLACDWTGSGRSVASVEDYVRADVLPLYANSHSSVNLRAEQTTLWLHEARQELRQATRAGDEHAVLFVSSGATGAANLLRSALRLPQPPLLVADPLAHHSNLLPWREVAHSVHVPRLAGAEVDLVDLEAILREIKPRAEAEGRAIVGAFTAVSNVNGLGVDVGRVGGLLRSFGALAVWDFASAAASEDLSFRDECMDAMFFSGHKLVGGPGTPGCLVAKRSLFRNPVPASPGGGSVFFVQPSGQTYLKEAEYREEAGTPDIVGAIRLALCLRLKRSLGLPTIRRHEHRIVRRMEARLRRISGLKLLGPSEGRRTVATFSFLVQPAVGETRPQLFLHHNFVSVLLDNVFGIESRSGCLCAGPYAQALLGIGEGLAERFEAALREPGELDRLHLRRRTEYSQLEFLRPGLTRLSLSYLTTDEEVDFVADAVAFVAAHGWRFLPLYRLNPETGEWHHHLKTVFKERKWLGRVRFGPQGLSANHPRVAGEERWPAAPDAAECLREAARLAAECADAARKVHVVDQRRMLSGDAADLRWFLLSSEAKELLLASSSPQLPKSPFWPSEDLCRESTEATGDGPSTAASPAPLPLGLSSSSQTKPEKTSSEEDPAPTKKLSVASEASKALTVREGCSDGVCGVSSGSLRQDWSRRTVVRPVVGAEAERGLWKLPPKDIYRQVVRAVTEEGMIRPGDRVLVCLSGGKDSLSLLHCLRQYQFQAAASGAGFELGAVTVDPGSEGYDPSPLIGYLRRLNVTYLYERQDILAQALALPALSSICAFCSRMKRGRLYAAARQDGWNVLAFGQHLDDLAETFLLQALHNAALRTMMASYTVKRGDLRVVRPLLHVREARLRDFAAAARLPVVPENCPACFHAPKERHRVKQLLAAEEILHPRIFHSLDAALAPLYRKTVTPNGQHHGEEEDEEDGS